MHIKDLIPWARQDATAQPKGQTEHPLAELQRQMNQVFESFWGKADRPFAGFDWPFGESTPRSDVVETADVFFGLEDELRPAAVRFDVPLARFVRAADAVDAANGGEELAPIEVGQNDFLSFGGEFRQVFDRRQLVPRGRGDHHPTIALAERESAGRHGADVPLAVGLEDKVPPGIEMDLKIAHSFAATSTRSQAPLGNAVWRSSPSQAAVDG